LRGDFDDDCDVDGYDWLNLPSTSDEPIAIWGNDVRVILMLIWM